MFGLRSVDLLEDPRLRRLIDHAREHTVLDGVQDDRTIGLGLEHQRACEGSEGERRRIRRGLNKL